jgi:hypothetical protein
LAEFLSPDQITTRRENLNRLSRNKRAAEELRGADYIACQGFLDYLANEDLVALLSSLHQSLAPNGELMVFNFRDQASRAYMEWVGNWYLNYRREEELADLADRAGVLSESVSIGSEETGADLFLHVIRDRV